MIRHNFAFLFAALLISGCSALTSVKPNTQDDPTGFEESIAIESFDPVAASTDDNPLFNVLAGEFAAQQGQFEEAFKYYLRAAEQTQQADVAKRATQMAILAKNPDAAQKSATIWSSVAPGDPQPLQVLILSSLRQNDEAAAVGHINNFLTATGGSDNAFISVATLLEKNTTIEAALRIMDDVAAHYPNNNAALHVHAKMLARSNQPEQALDKVEHALSLQPADERLILLRARLTGQLHGTAAEMDYLANVLANNDQLADTRVYHTRLLIDNKQFDQARRQLKQLADMQADRPEVLFTIGLLSLQMEDLAAARQYLEAAAPHLNQTNQHRAYFYLGQIEEQLGHLDNALAWFEKVRTGEFAFDAVIRTAVLMAQQQRLPEAIGLIHSLHVNSQPQAVKLILLESELLSNNGETQDAIKILTQSLAKFPDEVDILYARGMLYETIDALPEMEADMRRIIELEPKHIHALNSLGYTLADRTNRLEEALELVLRAHRLDPENPYVLDSVGWAYYRLGNFPNAIEYLNRALEAFPDTEVYLHLTEVLWESGQQRQASEVFKRALNADPDDERLKAMQQNYNLQ